LLEARFWRRLRSLHAAQGLFNEAAVAQKHVVSVIGHILGNDCIVCLDERLLLLDYLQKSSQWNEALELASQFDVLLKGRSSKDEDAQRVRSKLYWFSDSFHQAFPEVAASRSPEYSIALVENYRKFRSHDRRTVDLWNQLWQQKSLSVSQREEAADKLIALLRNPTWTNINCADRTLLASLLLVRVLPIILGPNPITAVTMQDINEASALADDLVPASMQDSSNLYLQVKSMQAFALAKNSKPQMASDIIDSLHPSRSHFKNLFSVSGILQARRQLAITYKDLGRENLARKQFQAIYKLITTIVDPPERKQRLDDWYAQEKLYLSAPSPNPIQQ